MPVFSLVDMITNNKFSIVLMFLKLVWFGNRKCILVSIKNRSKAISHSQAVKHVRSTPQGGGGTPIFSNIHRLGSFFGF